MNKQDEYTPKLSFAEALLQMSELIDSTLLAAMKDEHPEKKPVDATEKLNQRKKALGKLK